MMSSSTQHGGIAPMADEYLAALRRRVSGDPYLYAPFGVAVEVACLDEIDRLRAENRQLETERDAALLAIEQHTSGGES